MTQLLPSPSPLPQTPSGEVNLLALYLERFDRPNTRRAYQNDLIDFFGTPEVTLERVRHVTFVEVNRYLQALEAQHRKPATLHRRLAALRGFFDWLVALGALTHNPAHRQLVRRLQPIHASSRSVLYLTAEEAARLLEAAGSDPKAGLRDYTLLLTLIFCTLRRSEAAAMDVQHLRRLGAYWVLELPQTKGGAHQFVKVPEAVVEAIEAMKNHYGIVQGPLWRSLSRRNYGRRLTPHSIYRIVVQAAQQAGLPHIGAHTLRHTGCTLALEAGASLEQVQAHARHRHIATTLRYIHQRDRLASSAADFIRIELPRKP